MKFCLWICLLFLISCNSVESDRRVKENAQIGNVKMAKQELISIDKAIMLGDLNRALSQASAGLERTEQTADESLICSFKLRLATINRINGNFKQSIESLNWINLYARKLKNDSLELYSFLQLGDAYKALTLMNIATSCYLNANEIIDRNKAFRNQKYIIYKSLGMVFEGIADYNRAIYFYQKSLEEGDTLSNINSVQTHRCLANCYLFINDEKKAFQQIKLMEKCLRAEPRLDNYVNLFSAKGDVYLKLSRFDSALIFYSKAERIAVLDHDINSVAINQTKIAHIYTEKGDWTSALRQNRKALALRKNIKSEILTSSSLANIGMNYYQTGKIDSAEFFLLESLALARQLESSVFTTRAFTKLVSFYIQTADNEKALTYFRAQQGYLDSLTKVNQRLNTDLILSVSDFDQIEDESNGSFSEQFSNGNLVYAILVIGLVTLVFLVLIFRSRQKVKSKHAESPFIRKPGFMFPIPVNVLDSINIGISVSDEKEQLLFCNQVFAQMLGYQADELTGKNLLYITTVEQIDTYKRETLIRETGITSKYETVLRTINGVLIKVKVNASPFPMDNGKIGTIAIVSNLSDEDRLSTQLVEIASKLDRLEISQGTFLIDIIKEIKNPLGKIQRVIDDFLKIVSLGDEVKFRLRVISSEVERIHRFDEDLRNYCEVKSGTVKQLNSAKSVIELLTDLKQSVEKHFNSNYFQGGTLAISFPEEADGIVAVDLSRLERIICRLMDHLFQKSVTKAVSIGCSLTSDENIIFDVSEWRVKQKSMEDSRLNSGMSGSIEYDNYNDHITMPVALHMVKAYTEAMHGRFWTDESLLTGSKYYLAFPCNKTSDEIAPLI